MKRFPRAATAAAILALCAFGARAQAQDEPPPADSGLDAALFYQLLLGELNVRGEEPGAGFALILDAARKTNDPELYQRAVELAFQSRSGDAALQAARDWKKAFPQSREANRYVLQILVALNRMGEIAEPLRAEIALADPNDRAAVINALPRNFARVTDKKLAATSVEQALSEYTSKTELGPAAWTTI